MINPIESLLLHPDRQATQNADSNHIRVTEAIDCRNANRRFFSMLNRESSLEVILSEESTMTSCKLAGHEIVFSPTLVQEPHETWAIGDRPYQKQSNFLWNSHVSGSELILSSSSSHPNYKFRNLIPNLHTTLHYILTRENELNCTSKLKSIHMQQQVFYFNLRQALPPSIIDGHRLAISCNGSLKQIQVQPTRLLCKCNKSQSPPMPSQTAQSLVSEIPFELRQRLVHSTTDACASRRSDGVIVCDAIYSRESTSAHDFIEAQLQFGDRSVTFRVQSGLHFGPVAANSSVGRANVSSSTHTVKPVRQLHECGKDNAITGLMQHLVKVEAGDQRTDGCLPEGEQKVDESNGNTISSSPNSHLDAVHIKLEPQESEAISSSEPTFQLANNKAKAASSSSSRQPSMMLRLRVRVTNFGICILPHMMTNYTSSYKFSW